MQSRTDNKNAASPSNLFKSIISIIRRRFRFFLQAATVLVTNRVIFVVVFTTLEGLLSLHGHSMAVYF